MAQRQTKQWTIEEYDAWSASNKKFKQVEEASDECGGPALSLVPAREQNDAWPTDLLAWACIRSNQMPLHKAWMMRSYGLTLIFILARVPDAFMDTEADSQFLSDMLWSLVIAALIAPELILTTQTLWKIRSARARQAAAMSRQEQVAAQ